MSRIQDATILITGGASGIGLLMAQRVLEEGAAGLVIWDVDAESLSQTLSDLGDRASGGVVDMGDADAIRKAAGSLPPIDILINNAGIVVGRPFAEHTHEDIERTMAVNAMGPMHLARCVLPGMRDRGRGHIVNISSASALTPAPNMSVYASSKSALLGFSDALRIELEHRKSPIKVTGVTPFYINTGMFDGVRSPLIPVLDPEYAVQQILKAVRRDRPFLRMPWLVKTAPALKALLPYRVFDALAEKVFGIYSSMDHFRGRS